MSYADPGCYELHFLGSQFRVLEPDNSNSTTVMEDHHPVTDVYEMKLRGTYEGDDPGPRSTLTHRLARSPMYFGPKFNGDMLSDWLRVVDRVALTNFPSTATKRLDSCREIFIGTAEARSAVFFKGSMTHPLIFLLPDSTTYQTQSKESKHGIRPVLASEGVSGPWTVAVAVSLADDQTPEALHDGGAVQRVLNELKERLKGESTMKRCLEKLNDSLGEKGLILSNDTLRALAWALKTVTIEFEDFESLC